MSNCKSCTIFLVINLKKNKSNKIFANKKWKLYIKLTNIKEIN